MNVYKDQIIQVELPRGFVNISIVNNGDFKLFTASNDDEFNVDSLMFPLPYGDWCIKGKRGEKIVVLEHKARKRKFFSKWY